MNQAKGNKKSRFFTLMMAGALSAASLSAGAEPHHQGMHHRRQQ